jgi:hypothetical protein
MADQVQYIMDRMSSTFRKMEKLNLFTREEVKSIVKKRTDYEYLMQRRQLLVSDVYGYIKYELNLEKLRVIRSSRESSQDAVRNEGESLKDRKDAIRNIQAAFVRHISYVFERAIRRFTSEMSLWTDYIAFLRDKQSNTLLNAIYGRALSLHPKEEDFWLQAAIHELDINNNSHAARVILQRSLRSNKTSKKLWLRYFQLELWNSARITERQRILGLDIDESVISDGAPAVVFKHAIIAITDLNFACELHNISATTSISDDLANKLEIELRKQHGNECKLWEYLLNFTMKKHYVNINDNNEMLVGEGKLKRKRQNNAAVDIILSTSRSYRDIVVLLKEAFEATKQNQLAFNLEFSQLVANTISQAVKYSTGTIGSISEENLNLLSKSKRFNNGDINSNELESELSTSLGEFKSAFNELLSYLEETTGDYLNTHSFINEKSIDITVVPLSASIIRTKHYAWLVSSSLNLQLSSTYTCDITSLIEWLNAISIKCLNIKGNKTKFININTNEVELNSAIVGWSGIVEDTFNTFNKLQVLDIDSEIINSCMTSLGNAISIGSSTVISCDAGVNVLYMSLETLSQYSYSTVLNILQNVIISPYCQDEMRGAWCTTYVRFFMASSSSNSKSIEYSLLESFHWVDNSLHKSPHLQIRSNMEPFYSLILGILLDTIRSMVIIEKNSKNLTISSSTITPTNMPKNELYKFSKQISEKAISSCPNVVEFFDIYEDIERSFGNHKLANHIKWKRESGDKKF